MPAQHVEQDTGSSGQGQTSRLCSCPRRTPTTPHRAAAVPAGCLTSAASSRDSSCPRGTRFLLSTTSYLYCFTEATEALRLAGTASGKEVVRINGTYGGKVGVGVGPSV